MNPYVPSSTIYTAAHENNLSVYRQMNEDVRYTYVRMCTHTTTDTMELLLSHEKRMK